MILKDTDRIGLGMVDKRVAVIKSYDSIANFDLDKANFVSEIEGFIKSGATAVAMVKDRVFFYNATDSEFFEISSSSFQPDQVVQAGTISNVGNNVTIDGTVTSWIWRISNLVYENSTSQVFAITPPAAGNFRYDIITGDNTGAYAIVNGTPAASSDAAIIPTVPSNRVGLGIVFSNDTGVTEVLTFALSAFVRFDISNQPLTAPQRANARGNIQAVSKDTDDTRTGGLTNEGKVTVDLDEASAALPIVEIKQQGVTKHVFTGDEARIIPHLLRVNSPIAPTVRGASFRGSTNGGDPIFEIQNSSGTKIFYPRGTGGIGQLRSNASDESIRRDENYLTFPATVAGTGKLNDVALADGVGMVKFAATVTDVSGIVSNNADQKELLVWTDNTDGITLTEQDTDSVAANRFLRQINVPYRTPVRIVYESSTGRWVNGNTGELQETDARYFEVVDDVLTLKYILPDIAALQAFVRGPAVLAYVSDPLRGGNFNYVSEADFVGSPDFGISFPAQDGGYWVRDYSGAILVDWYGAVGDGVTDDILALEGARDAMPELGGMALTGGKKYAVSRTFEFFKPASSGTGSGNLTLSSKGGTSQIVGLSGIDVVLDIQGKQQTTRNNWFFNVEDIKVTGPDGCQTLVRIGGGDTWHGSLTRCWFESGVLTQQLVAMTNTNVANFRDYFTTFNRCVFRGAKHNIVIGGEFVADTLVPCLQPTNRAKLTDCDFYGYDRYGIYMSRASGGDGTNGHTMKGIHFDSAATNAIADIFWSSSFHYVEGVFESGADFWVDFENTSAGGILNCAGLLAGSAVARFALAGVAYTGNFPLPALFNQMTITTSSNLGNLHINARAVREIIYGIESRDITIAPLTGRQTEFKNYEPSTNTFTEVSNIDNIGLYSLKGTVVNTTDGNLDFNRTFGLAANTNVEVYQFTCYSSSSTTNNMMRIGYLTVFGTAGLSQETTSLQENGNTDTIVISRPSENVIRFAWTGFRTVTVRLTRVM